MCVADGGQPCLASFQVCAQDDGGTHARSGCRAALCQPSLALCLCPCQRCAAFVTSDLQGWAEVVPLCSELQPIGDADAPCFSSVTVDAAVVPLALKAAPLPTDTTLTCPEHTGLHAMLHRLGLPFCTWVLGHNQPQHCGCSQSGPAQLAGHEMAHSMTSATANFVCSGESGDLNEAISYM